jgi:L-rhamnose mutarotase
MPHPATKRYALTLDLRDDPELIAEYKRVHSPEGSWPEIAAGIRAVGILDMEIYLEGTRLFMLMETPADFAFDARMALLATLPRQAEWEAFVSRFQRLQHSTPEASSAEKWRPMERIFTLPLPLPGTRPAGAPDLPATPLCPREG